MKRFLTLALIVLVTLYALSGCGCDNGENADLVFVNDSDTAIVAVVADFEDQLSGVQHADSSPMQRGETFGFEAGEYPVTVLVYDTVVDRVREGELARAVIPEAPQPQERWYVIARDGVDGGLVLTVTADWPEGGPGKVDVDGDLIQPV